MNKNKNPIDCDNKIAFRPVLSLSLGVSCPSNIPVFFLQILSLF